jgi:hypothetical protein
MSTIVGVHGIAQEQGGRNLLLPPWSHALADGMERATGAHVALPDLDLAFYGDLFLGSSGDGRKSPLPDLGADDADFILDAARDLPVAADLTVGEAKGFAAIHPALLRLVAALDRRCGQHAGALFVGELAQARRYLADQGVKDAVDARVDAEVGSDCRVLIGHSLGSVVALEHVRLHPRRRFDLFLTMGSPLGLRAVRHLLPDPPFGTEPGGPPNVGIWCNLRDPRDPVALGGGLSLWWPGVRDDDTIDNGRQPHAAVRYLAKRQTGTAVLDVLPGQPER